MAQGTYYIRLINIFTFLVFMILSSNTLKLCEGLGDNDNSTTTADNKGPMFGITCKFHDKFNKWHHADGSTRDCCKNKGECKRDVDFRGNGRNVCVVHSKDEEDAVRLCCLEIGERSWGTYQSEDHPLPQDKLVWQDRMEKWLCK